MREQRRGVGRVTVAMVMRNAIEAPSRRLAPFRLAARRARARPTAPSRRRRLIRAATWTPGSGKNRTPP